MAIDNCFRLGKIRGHRPILIKFIATRWVRNVFNKVRGFKKFNLSIVNDRSKSEREEFRKLKMRVSQLSEFGIIAKLKGNTVLMEGKRLDLPSVDQILLQLANDKALDSGNSERNVIESVESMAPKSPKLRKRKMSIKDSMPIATPKQNKSQKSISIPAQVNTLDDYN